MNVSVIIPTHNRSRQLRLSLDALNAQTFPTEEIEVIVVADGCVDDTAVMLRSYQARFTLRVLSRPQSGAAVSRNRGAEAATGDLLIFLDDDIEASPGLIEGHVAAQRRLVDGVVIGYLPYALRGRADLFRMHARAWWQDLFSAMRQPGLRFTYQHLLSGNFSLSSTLFERVRGFDETLPCREDYEFGARLIKLGVCFAFSEAARGAHYDDTTLDRSLRRKLLEGRADVCIGRRHPELRPGLRLASFEWPAGPFRGTLRWLAFAAPSIGDRIADIALRALTPVESVRLRALWARAFHVLLDYWYWRGVAAEIGTRRALAALIQAGPARSDSGGREIQLDLADGLAMAEARLDAERPDGAVIVFGRHPVGRLTPQAGAERLRGAHLRPTLGGTMLWPLMQALAWQRVSGSADRSGTPRLPRPAEELWEQLESRCPLPS